MTDSPVCPGCGLQRKRLLLHQQRSPLGSECKNAYFRTLETQCNLHKGGGEKAIEESVLEHSEDDYFQEFQTYDDENYIEPDVDIADRLSDLNDGTEDAEDNSCGEAEDAEQEERVSDSQAGAKIVPAHTGGSESGVHDENLYFLDADEHDAYTEYTGS